MAEPREQFLVEESFGCLKDEDKETRGKEVRRNGICESAFPG